MKVIYAHSDLQFRVVFYDADNNIININQVKDATIKLFTDDEIHAAIFKRADIDEDSCLSVDASILSKMRNGILYYKYTIVFSDPSFPDKDYTHSDVYQTNLYLQNRPEMHKPTTATCVSELYNDAGFVQKEWLMKHIVLDDTTYAPVEYVDAADASIKAELELKADSSTTYTKNQANQLFVTADDASTLIVQIINEMELPQGLQGTQGYIGTQGFEGAQGAEGPQGVIGTQGEQGTQGLIGTQGEQGIRGEQGTQGVIGTQGYEGPQGAAGTPGQKGADGNPGVQGERGTQGFMGTQGEVGAQGFIGTQGYEGPQGIAGTPGEKGADGNPGAQGEQGTQGFIGTQGEQGTVGTQGFIGTQGLQGTQGEKGVQGEPGPASQDFYTKTEIDSMSWYGTQQEYDALGSYDNSTNYYILL